MRGLEPRGIEPRFAECDSAVIPLDHGPGDVARHSSGSWNIVKRHKVYKALTLGDSCAYSRDGLIEPAGSRRFKRDAQGRTRHLGSRLGSTDRTVSPSLRQDAAEH